MSPTDTVEAAAARTGWGTAPLWTIARRVDRTGFPDAELLSVYRDWGVVRKADRDDNFNVESDDLSSYKFVKRGDLVLNKMKTWQGSLGVSDFEGIVSPAYFTCELSPTVHPRFIHYLLRSDLYIGMYAAASKGIRPNQWDLPYEEFRSLEGLLPPLEEQRRIADFLDEQVKAIDCIILARRDQQSLMQSAVAAEVERVMLDASASPKVRASRLLNVLPGYAFPSDGYTDDDSGIRLLRGVNIGVGVIRWDEVVRWPSSQMGEVEAFRLHPEDIVMGMDRPWIGGGLRIARLGPDDCPALLLQRVARITPLPGVDPGFVVWAFRASAFRVSVESNLTGLSVPHLSVEQILDYRMPLLSLAEQKQIATRLDQVSEAGHRLSGHLLRSVSLLEDLKRSLITAAVTGELDVTTARRGVPA